MNPDTPAEATPEEPALLHTGVRGLDEVLGGGLHPHRLYLLEGSPGTGKTTVALQFLMDGRDAGERCLYVSLSESHDELLATARSHGWSLDGIEIFEPRPPDSIFDESQQQSLLYSSDLELGETTRMVFEQVARVKPTRMVLDSLSEIRLLAQSSLRYRRQILATKHHLMRLGTTVLMLDDLSGGAQDGTVHSIAHAVVQLDHLSPGYGAARRRLRVAKYRGQAFRGGYHDFAILRGGVQVFPRLVAAEHATAFARDILPSGNGALDSLLGGGIERGTSTLILGPSGAGKTLLALRFVLAAVERGEHAAMFTFDEETSLLMDRAEGVGVGLRAIVASGGVTLEQVDAAELSPGEFADRVRRAVQDSGARTVVIDSLNGYEAAMPEERALTLHMHELLSFLNRAGTQTFLTVAQHGLMGDMGSPAELTYLSDTVILLRFFEAVGRVRRAISAVKKRAGAHEDLIREFVITSAGLVIGRPLTGFHGVLRGVPELLGSAAVTDASAPGRA